MDRALLIEFNVNSGERAGGINPRDPNLPCYGWQDLESRPGREIRLVKDDRDLSQYQGITGVTILEGKDTINTAIEQIVTERYKCQNEGIMLEHMKQKGITLDEYAGHDQNFILKDLYNKKVAGIIKRLITKLE